MKTCCLRRTARTATAMAGQGWACDGCGTLWVFVDSQPFTGWRKADSAVARDLKRLFKKHVGAMKRRLH